MIAVFVYFWAFSSREYLARRREVATARSLAREIEMAARFYGFADPGLSRMSDEELVAHMAQAQKVMAEVMSASSVTAAEAAQAMTALGKALKAPESVDQP